MNAIPWRMKLDRIETPSPAHVDECIRRRKLDPDEVAVGIAVAEVILRGVVNADISRRAEVIRQAADALTEWLRIHYPTAA